MKKKCKQLHVVAAYLRLQKINSATLKKIFAFEKHKKKSTAVTAIIFACQSAWCPKILTKLNLLWVICWWSWIGAVIGPSGVCMDCG